jgi:hypothetical protein
LWPDRLVFTYQGRVPEIGGGFQCHAWQCRQSR